MVIICLHLLEGKKLAIYLILDLNEAIPHSLHGMIMIMVVSLLQNSMIVDICMFFHLIKEIWSMVNQKFHKVRDAT